MNRFSKEDMDKIKKRCSKYDKIRRATDYMKSIILRHKQYWKLNSKIVDATLAHMTDCLTYKDREWVMDELKLLRKKYKTQIDKLKKEKELKDCQIKLGV